MYSIRILGLVLLVASTLAQVEKEQQNKTELEYNYDQLSRILEAPIFRQNPPTVDSYMPQEFGVSEPEVAEETKTTASSYLVPIPSMMLQAPSKDAIDSFGLLSTPEASAQTFSAYPYSPLIKIASENLQKKPATTYTKKYYPQEDSYFPINPVSKQLDIPLSDPNPSEGYPPVPATELQVPNLQPYNDQFSPSLPANVASFQPFSQDDIFKLSAEMVPPHYPEPSLELELPRAESIKPIIFNSNLPSQAYPKKYNPDSDDSKSKKTYKNVPIIEIISDEPIDISKLKKINKAQKLTYQPVEVISQGNDETDNRYLKKLQAIEKERHKFEEAQKKLKNKKENELRQQRELFEATRPKNTNTEQEASETGFNSFQQDTGFASPANSGSTGFDGVIHDEGGDRTEFQMHGQHGPHSYKFGYDTGKGKNRQFRYEERDNDGYVKGHYGFYDKHGKLQVVNYDAHPHHGFHAEGSFGRV